MLLLLVATYFVTAIAGDHQWGRVASLVLLAATTWLALRASHVERELLRWAVALIPMVTAIAVVATVLGSEETGRGVAAVADRPARGGRAARHRAAAPAAHLGHLQHVLRAICIYLLIAMLFASVYAFTAWVRASRSSSQIEPPAHVGTIDYLYFSFITITTVGYGDLTAASSLGRMTAACEAVLGQLYLITVIALVVQNLGQARHFKNIRKRLRDK